jgi:glutathione S-transferase
LDRQLGDQPYLTGEKFTIADAYAYAILNWTKIHKIDMRRWTRLMAFMDRLLPGQPCCVHLLRRDSRHQSD